VKGSLAGSVALLACLAWGRNASAQLRWDVEAQGGLQRHALTSKPPGTSDADVGPLVEASGHVALIPLLRVGLYGAYQSGRVPSQATTQLFSSGLDLRLLFPWPRGDYRVYARAAIGEGVMYAPAHPPVAAASGSFTEVPVALGFAYRVHAPLWLTAETGARFGFASRDDNVAGYLDFGLMWGR
jgi:hypothetical protein